MIGKCIASRCKATFFLITASSLTSKWIGEGEKLVRALFGVAAHYEPSVIFIDEIDSLLSSRSSSEHESSRRMKNEFLANIDGFTTESSEGAPRVLIVGATNLPQQIDSAARRRFSKRLYIPLPEARARRELIVRLLHDENHVLSKADIDEVARRTENFSCADVAQLCSEAAMGSMRDSVSNISEVAALDHAGVDPISKEHFLRGLQVIKSTVTLDDLTVFDEWNRQFGTNVIAQKPVDGEI